MGVSIYLSISKSVTQKEWESVYQETLQLVKAFPLAERREVPIRGIPTLCMVRTQEREERYGWRDEKVMTGWFADGDYEYLCVAERYSLRRDLISDEHYEEDAPDALLGAAPSYVSGFDWKDERCRRCLSLWGPKTQGEPYHLYLLAVACLIESRLGKKAFVYGDITKGQCERAVHMANKYLDQPIQTPDQCDMQRFANRIKDLTLTEGEKLKLFLGLYIGDQGTEFGECIREHFSKKARDHYWKEELRTYRFDGWGSSLAFHAYLYWGFDLEEMCSFLRLEDDDGTTHYEDFVNKIMEAELHHPNDKASSEIEIDSGQEITNEIDALFVQFLIRGAFNKGAGRYIPISEIRVALSNAIGDRCPVNKLIDKYLEKEMAQELPNLSSDMSDEDREKAIEQDPSHVLNETMKASEEIYQELHAEYDISDPDDLPFYRAGDSILPALLDPVKKSFLFYQGALSLETYALLMSDTPKERCRWLSESNKYVLLRDTEWEKIFDDIMSSPESFARYYPMDCVVIKNDGLRAMVRAFVTNDEFYAYMLEESKAAEKTSESNTDD